MKFAQTDKIALPDGFLDGFKELPPQQKQSLIEALESTPAVSIRLNLDKTKPSDIEFDTDMRVDWCSSGYYLPQRPTFTLDPLHHAGAYYVQEAGSMFIEQLIKQGSYVAEQPSRVLDLCASPGGKSTLLSSLVAEGSMVVANEVIRARASILAENVRRWGLGNCVVTSNDATHFGRLPGLFDLIVVDAPCSGEGMFRKDHKTRSAWSPLAVELCAARQRRILSDIWPSLKDGGTLIYSTCTFNNSENEDNVRWMKNNFDCQPITINIPDDWNILRGNVNGIETFRFLPDRVQSEGFFAAILRKGSGGKASLFADQELISAPQSRAPRKKGKISKQGQAERSLFTAVSTAEAKELSRWVAEPEQMWFAKIGEMCYCFDKSYAEDLKLVAQNLTAIYSGVAMGRFYSRNFKPDHALSLYKGLDRRAVNSVELTKEQALEYLRKHDLDAGLFEEGINLLCFRSTPIGWLKRSGNRTTNMLPKELRIVNL